MLHFKHICAILIERFAAEQKKKEEIDNLIALHLCQGGRHNSRKADRIVRIEDGRIVE